MCFIWLLIAGYFHHDTDRLQPLTAAVDCYYNSIIQKKEITNSRHWHTNLNHKMVALGGFSETWIKSVKIVLMGAGCHEPTSPTAQYTQQKSSSSWTRKYSVSKAALSSLFPLQPVMLKVFSESLFICFNTNAFNHADVLIIHHVSLEQFPSMPSFANKPIAVELCILQSSRVSRVSSLWIQLNSCMQKG